MLLKHNIPLTYVIGKIRNGLIFVSIYSVVIVTLYELFHITRITIPLSVPMILGTVISLLLGFRSNQAYDRWWEARVIWGAIVNDSRTLARQTLSFIKDPYESPESHLFRHKFIRRQIAWVHCLTRHLRKEDPVQGLSKFLSEDELSFISRYSNKPAALLQLHAKDLSQAQEAGWLNRYQHVELDRSLTRLCDAMGKCERIKNTIFPATYSLYIHFSLNLFIILLPFGLIEYFGLMEIPIVIAVAASFMLIEKMAIHLQDPFENKPTDTPMTTISKTIEKDLKQMINDHNFHPEALLDTAETLPRHVYYLM